jgi:hypothetical protein
MLKKVFYFNLPLTLSLSHKGRGDAVTLFECKNSFLRYLRRLYYRPLSPCGRGTG